LSGFDSSNFHQNFIATSGHEFTLYLGAGLKLSGQRGGLPMRSLVMKVAVAGDGSVDFSGSVRKALEGDAVDLQWLGPDELPIQDCDGLIVDSSHRDSMADFRQRFPLAAIVVLTDELHSDLALELVRRGADEVLPQDHLDDLYQRLRLARERRNQDWNRSLRDGHLYQVQKLEAVGRMAAGVAHDVRHLAQIILGNCSLALRCSVAHPELQSMLCDARSATEKSLNLVNRLLRFVVDEPYRGQATRLDLWLDQQRPLIEAANQRRRGIEFCVPEEIWIEVDPAVLEQVLLNLTLNGLDAIGRQGSLWIHCDGVQVDHPFLLGDRWLEPGRYAALTVADDGAGVAIEHQKTLFEPFFTTKKELGGTGLGLSTVLALLHSLGGNLLFQSFPGSGTCMRAFFPAIEREAHSCTSLLGPFLIVEADPGERLNHRQYLESFGAVVLEAREPAEALRLLRTHRPQTIIAEAHQLAGHADSLGAFTEDCQRLVTSLFPQSWLERKGLIPPGWQYLAKPWNSRNFGRPT
jgi:signal transduction histidine kinase